MSIKCFDDTLAFCIFTEEKEIDCEMCVKGMKYNNLFTSRVTNTRISWFFNKYYKANIERINTEEKGGGCNDLSI